MLFVRGTGGTDARIELYRKQGSSWTRAIACAGWVGENGIGAAREGWAATPEGDFTITGAFGVQPSPGTALPYLQVGWQHYWCADPAFYNQLVDINQHPHYCRGEHFASYPTAYAYGLTFDYNANPPAVGAGSAFFVHCKINRNYTGGCVMMEQPNMVAVIRALSPGAKLCIHYN